MSGSGAVRASVLTLAELFSNRNEFRLPHFQRAYAWDVDLATRLLTDVIEASQKPQEARRMFLGRLLLARQEDTAAVSVIDGHQRLVTLTILFCVLRDVAREGVAHALCTDRIASGAEGRAFRLQPHAGLAGFLEEYVQAPGGTSREFDGDLGDLSETEANVLTNRDYFRAELATVDQGAIADLARFLCEACRAVIIEVEDELEAWAMLQVEEQTRLDFTATDRARASILSVVPKSERDACGQTWAHWQDELGADGLRALLSHIRTIELRTRSDIPVEAELIRHFELQKGAARFFEATFEPAARDYAALFSARTWRHQEAAAVQMSLDMIRWIDGQSWAPAALVWLRTRGAQHEDTALFFRRIERLVWLLRLAGVDPNVQQNRYLKLLSQIESGTAVREMSTLVVEGRMLTGALSNLRSRTFYSKHYCSAVLRRICVTFGAEPAALAGKGITIEHILPRNPVPKSDWWRSFASKEIVAEHANRIGNLCLLSHADNQRAGARSYAEKQSVLAGSEFKLANAAGTAADWNAREVQRRGEEMIARLLEAWELRAGK